MKKNKAINYLLILAILISSLIFTEPAGAATGEYHIKVNRLANTVTVYKKQGNGSFKPIKAMLCSTGGYLTPLGTFRTSIKYRWRFLYGNVWGQYSTRISGPILFHSIPYYRQNGGTMMRGQFEKLGSIASHGCVRLSAEDTKWIYDNCSLGTKVTIYDSKDPGPLGKPEPTPYLKYTGFDPTDTWSSGRPIIKPEPVITLPKKITLSRDDTSFDLLKGVKATSYYGTDITDEIEIEDDIDFEIPGDYTITYTVTDKYGNTASKSITAVIK